MKGNNCPHFNSEKDREPSVNDFIKNGIIDSCYASDDGSALHFKDGKVFSAVSFYKDANSYYLSYENNQVKKEIIDSISIYWTLFIVPFNPVTSHFIVLNSK